MKEPRRICAKRALCFFLSLAMLLQPDVTYAVAEEFVPDTAQTQNAAEQVAPAKDQSEEISAANKSESSQAQELPAASPEATEAATLANAVEAQLNVMASAAPARAPGATESVKVAETKGAAKLQFVVRAGTWDAASIKSRFAEVAPKLNYTLDDGAGNTTSGEVTNDTLALLGMKDMPKITTGNYDANASTIAYSVDKLPSTITKGDTTYTLSYSLSAPEQIRDFALAEVDGTHYALIRSDAEFTFKLGSGKTTFTKKQITKLFSTYAHITLDSDSGDTTSVPDWLKPFTTIEELADAEVVTDDKGNVSDGGLNQNSTFKVWIDNSNTVHVHGNGPRYDLDGNRIDYRFQEIAAPAGGVWSMAALQGDLPDGVADTDYLMPRDFVKKSDRGAYSAREGSGFTLTLGGDATITAYQYWDDFYTTPDQKLANRANVTFQLWRYTDNASANPYASATVMRYPATYRDTNKAGTPIVYSFTNDNKIADFNTVTFAGEPGDNGYVLPKYDTTGARLVYILKERVNPADGQKTYSTTYGTKADDGSFAAEDPENEDQQAARKLKGVYLVDGDAVQNSYNEYVSPSVTVSWDMESFPRELTGLSVIAKLQYKKNGEWKDYGTYKMDKFDLDTTAKNFVVNAPKYDNDGNDIEYKWDFDTVEYMKESVKPTKVTENLPEGVDEAYEFTLHFGSNIVTFDTVISSAKDKEGELIPGSNVIKSTIRNKVDYSVTKFWVDKAGNDASGDSHVPDSITINLFRTMAGSKNSYKDQDAWAKIKLSKDSAEVIQQPTKNEDIEKEDPKISVISDGNWGFSIDGLKQFNKYGKAFNYSVMESGKFNPQNITSKTDPKTGAIHTDITNPVGFDPTAHIVIKKSWLDGTDLMAHGDATFEVFTVKTDADGNETRDKELGTAKMDAASGSWMISYEVPVGTDMDTVRVRETRVDSEYGIGPSGKMGEGYALVHYDSNVAVDGDFQVADPDKPNSLKVNYRTKVARDDQEGMPVFDVVNERYKTVNIDVDKTWVAGNNTKVQKFFSTLDAYNAAHAGAEVYPAEVLTATPHEDKSDEMVLSLTRNASGADILTVDSPATSAKSYPIYADANQTTPGASYALITTDKLKQGSDGRITVDATSLSMNGLPLYDNNGAQIGYKVAEVWLKKNGDKYDQVDLGSLGNEATDLRTAWASFAPQVSLDQQASDDGSTNELNYQKYNIQNKLVGTKTVSWTKQWHDYFSFMQGTRPDLSLKIWQVSQDNKGNMVVAPYVRDFDWSAASANADTLIHGSKYLWRATFASVPAYNEWGYPITYYAAEGLGNTAFNFYRAQKYRFDVMDNNNFVPSTTEYAFDAAGTSAENNIPDGSEITVKSDLYETAKDTLALREGGTFVNRITDSTDLEFTKNWTNLPEGFALDDLPAATFTLTRTRIGVADDQPETVGTFTISDWSKPDTTKTDTDDQGVSTQSISKKLEINAVQTDTAADGSASTSLVYVEKGKKGPGLAANQQWLPRYSPEGYMYSYKWAESVDYTLSADSDVLYDTDFKYTGFGRNLTITNAFKQDKVKIQLSKALTTVVPHDKAPAAVKFVIYRSYQDADGNVVTEGKPQTVIFKQDDFEVHSKNNWTISKDLKLLKRAPNGSVYQYQIVEWKVPAETTLAWGEKIAANQNGGQFLGDYNTEVSLSGGPSSSFGEDVNASTGQFNFATSIDANSTMLSEGSRVDFNNTNNEMKKVSIDVTKVWDDGDNMGNTRPSELKLHVYREAASQPGQNNGVAKELAENVGDEGVITLTADELSKSTDTVKLWSKQIGDLDAYAPNGMPWKYTVSENNEDVPVGYTRTSQNEIFQYDVTKLGTSELTATGSIANTIYKNFSWQKKYDTKLTGEVGTWKLDIGLQVFLTPVDADGTKGTEKAYNVSDAAALLGLSSTDETIAENALLIKPGQTATMASVLHGADGTGIAAQPTGAANAVAASAQITLPAYYVGKDDQGYLVRYRFFEKDLTVSSGEKSHVETLAKLEDGELNAYDSSEEHKFVTAVKYNAATDSTTVITNHVAKVRAQLTEVWKDDLNNYWGLRPADGANWKTAFKLMRQAGQNGATTQPEQVVELSLSGASNVASKDSAVYDLPKFAFDSNGDLQEFDYNFVELNTDSADVADGGVYASYYGVGYANEVKPNNAGDIQHTTITNTMKHQAVKVEKTVYKLDDATNPSFTFDLKTSDAADATVVAKSGQLTLDGIADNDAWPTAIKPWETEAYKGQWDRLPVRLDADAINADPVAAYAVVENATDGYEMAASSVDRSGAPVFKFTNVQQGTFTVKKVWYTSENTDGYTVAAKLQRTVNGAADTSFSQDVLLNTDNQFTQSFTEPLFDANGNRYTYTVNEVKVNDKAVENGKTEDFFVASSTDSTNLKGNNPTGTFTLTNTASVKISGTKTWNDADSVDAVSGRDLKLTLYRGIKQDLSDVAEVEGVTPTITKGDGNEWTYAFNGQPYADANGNPYYYKVEESSPEHYDLEKTEATPAALSLTTNFTNVKRSELAVSKVLAGDKADPEHEFTFTVELAGTAQSGISAADFAETQDGVTFQGGKVTFTLKGGAAKTFWIPAGLTYTVSETDANTDEYHTTIQSAYNGAQLAEYETSSSQFAGTATQGGATKVQFTNEREYEPVVLNKVWKDEVERTARPDLIATGALHIWRTTAAQPTDTDWTEVTKQDNLVSKPGKAVEITQTVTDEFNDQYQFGEFSKYDENGNLYTYKVTEDTPAGYDQATTTTSTYGATVKNVERGSLTISKEITGNKGEQGRQFHFTVTLAGESEDADAKLVASEFAESFTTSMGGNVTFAGGVADFTLTGGESVEFLLPAGFTYSVVETDGDTNGYKTKINGQEALTNEGQVAIEGAIEVAYDNNRTYKPVTGTKTWVDDTELSARPELTLHLYRNIEGVSGKGEELDLEPTWTKTDATHDTYTYGDLPTYDNAGHKYVYLVEEDVPEHYDSVTTPGEDGYTFDFANYERAELDISKVLAGDKADAEHEFTFSVDLAGTALFGLEAADFAETLDNVSFESGKATFTLKGGESKTFWIPAGLTYTVSETDANTDEYHTTIQSAYNVADMSEYAESSSEFAGAANEGSATKVQFTNEREYEAVTMNKVWADEAERTARPDLVATGALHVWRTTAEQPTDSDWVEVTKQDSLADNPGKALKIAKTAADEFNDQYQFGEFSKYDENGNLYTYKVTEDTPVGYDQATLGTTTYGATVKNVERGSLTIAKEITGNKGEQGHKFHFTVTLTGESVDQDAKFVASEFSESFTTNKGESITFENGVAEFTLTGGESVEFLLPVGFKYRVVETDGDTDGYKTMINGEEALTNAGQLTLEGAVEVAYGNNRTYKSVTGTKTWVDETSRTARPELVLHLYRKIEGAQGKGEELDLVPSWTRVDATHDTYTYGDLPTYDNAGHKYVYLVEEDIPEHYDGVATAGEDGYNFDFTNYERAQLDISKVLKGNDTEANRKFAFEVTLSGTSLTGQKAEEYTTTKPFFDFTTVTFKDGVARFSLKGGENTVLEIPAGMVAQVTELDANKDGYTTTLNGKNEGFATAQSTAGSAHEFVFINERTKKLVVPTPRTGDTTTPYLPLTMSCAGVAMIALAIHLRKRRRS